MTNGTPITARIHRMRQYASISHCLALAAEARGDAKEAARLTLDAWLLDARSDQLARASFTTARRIAA